ncbi:hypothetical protein [Paraclostridium sordellii]|uniref:Uncharacterized protein n=1 Tax=Paraclostridium sordellii TaxID=1505 RepID=A0A0C7I0G2_PARSO|nr:hypothetical protein [Paeniclostridium sordellii]CEN78039.1 Uncharacterised protein [[Clostridium] sordellii] [Paeniclostridium sordellii]CEO07299.1 Uncharacterised protein [[Clostridium] sordellii] [Paeniclostridium sordellii]CEP86843.1 Uncharacterised protein [[Clostridium] sordellii] [Paeniclostridium sordellii]CEP97721.1 Uncharacterised protein [[Clostridium] sordellii] [Paeniclostridium sordellii]CEP99443.1 Uncharacterised protein [[Clostridium] sordellii] [Paeniclostridium sordellii]
MLIDAIAVKTKKSDVRKIERDKVPLMSKIVQLNPRIKNSTLQYIEYKVVRYNISLKFKGKSLFKQDICNNEVIMLVNTYTGFSESITKLPQTSRINISKKIIKKSCINECEMLEIMKDEILRLFRKNIINKKGHIHDIKVIDIKSIYKPYWIGTYNGKSVVLEA